MAAAGIAQQARDPRMTALRMCAFTIAALAGASALGALAVGTPFEFGVALALCAAAWVVADFIKWTVDGTRAGRRSTPRVASNDRGYGSRRVVLIGGGECPSRPTRRAIELADYRQSA
jgi:hypothetical protein